MTGRETAQPVHTQAHTMIPQTVSVSFVYPSPNKGYCFVEGHLLLLEVSSGGGGCCTLL